MIALRAIVTSQGIASVFACIFVVVVILAIMGAGLIIKNPRGSLPNRFGWLAQKFLAVLFALTALLMTFKHGATANDRVIGLCFMVAAAILTLVIKVRAPKKYKDKQRGLKRVEQVLD